MVNDIDPRIPVEQGYIVVSPNDPNPRGLLYFSETAAIDQLEHNQKRLSKWPDGYNLDYWKEKPEPYQIYALKISRRVR